ncbi:MAG: type II secretion system F family protein [Thioalkalispiraceae bacterium]|jgi:MSHA biogenesis protein MshG
MPLFKYKARNNTGDSLVGQLEANTLDSAATQLLKSGITPIEINELKQGNDYLKLITRKLRSRQPKLQDLIFLSRQMYTLMKAGVPIIRAINGLSDNLTNPMLVETMKDVVHSLESGRELSVAMAQHPKVFNHLFVSMVKVGESTGELEGAFLKLSEYLEREKDTRDKIKQAMRYPIIVFGFIIAAVIVINLFVIPQFEGIFSKFGADLPWQTKVLIASSNIMQTYWPHMAIASIALFFWLKHYLNTAKGRMRWDRIKLKIPLIGIVLYEAILARFATAFGLTVRSGVPLIQGLNVTSHAVDNVYIGEKIQQMRTGIEKGDSLTRTAASTKMFTPLTIQMIQVGEETGSVDDMLDNVSGYYDREVDYKLKNLSSAIEPIMIILIGAMVFMLALGVFLPLWDLSSVIKK